MKTVQYVIGNQLNNDLFEQYVRPELENQGVTVIASKTDEHDQFIITIERDPVHQIMGLLDMCVDKALFIAAIQSLIVQRPSLMGKEGKDDDKPLIYSRFVPKVDYKNINDLPCKLAHGSFKRLENVEVDEHAVIEMGTI